MSKKQNKSRKKKRSSNGSMSGGLVAMTFLIIGAAIAAFVFVACGDGSDNSEDASEAVNQSNFEESSVSEGGSESSSESAQSDDLTSDGGDSSEIESSDSSIDNSGEISGETAGEKYSHVAWFKAENGERYDAYGEKNSDYTAEQVVTYVNIGLDGPYYTNTYSANKEDGNFILVNKYSYVDKDFTPDGLVELDDSCKVSGKSVMLVKEAADAFKRLSEDAAALEYHIIGMSGYRTYSYQENLYNRYLQSDTKENVDTYSARPGYSEHHTGLALDVQTDTVSFSNFGQTKEYEWLLDNAHKYGFVIHYTEDNQWITGYMPEEWHIRYVGVEAATYIYDNNLSVDEYLVMYGANGPQAAG